MPTLLCIDDQENSLQVRKMFLESQGYDVLTATSGRQGLQILTDSAVDALILDYRMPGMDGEEVAVEARRLRPALPIIVLSGYVSDLPDALTRLADALVQKGAPPTALLQTITQFTGKSVKTPRANTPAALLDASRRQAGRSREQVRVNQQGLERVRPRRPRHR